MTRRLLRSRPPRRALAWAGAVLGGPVTSTRALRGGMSSAVHLITARTAAGQCQAVLRRYVRAEDEPGIAAREARALRFAASLGVPVPALLAVDPDGTRAGVPAVLMSRLPGKITWWPSDLDTWLARMAEVLARIHAAPPPPPGTIRGFAPEPPASCQPPAWARHPRVWQRAAEIPRGPVPGGPAVPLHGDFHPGNVLWRRGRVSGVVDWQAVSTGPAAADVAHCRVNLLTFGPAVADRFTRLWERAAGTSYHPWADVVTIIGFLDDLHDDWGSERLLVEDMLARAVAELGACGAAERLRRPRPGSLHIRGQVASGFPGLRWTLSTPGTLEWRRSHGSMFGRPVAGMLGGLPRYHRGASVSTPSSKVAGPCRRGTSGCWPSSRTL